MAEYSTYFLIFCLHLHVLFAMQRNMVGGMNKSSEDDAGDNKKFLSPYPISRLAPPYELVDLAKEIARADDMLSVQTNGKLRLLAEQIRGLQEEAQKILLETKRNQELHRAECSFQKKAGQVYHLYKKKNDSLVFSLLSPQDWGERLPYDFIGSFRLESDMSWTAIDK